MEENTILEILKLLAAVSIASSPGIYSLLKQNALNKTQAKIREAEVKIKESEKEKTDVELMKRIQGIYQELINDVKQQANESKQRIEELSNDMNNLRDENEILAESNRKLTVIVQTQSEEIKGLKKTVQRLLDQLKTLGIEPIFNNHNNE